MSKVTMNCLVREFIKWPTQQRKQDISDGFAEYCHFEGVIGAIDGTHIRIKAPQFKPPIIYKQKEIRFSGSARGLWSQTLSFRQPKIGLEMGNIS